MEYCLPKPIPTLEDVQCAYVDKIGEIRQWLIRCINNASEEGWTGYQTNLDPRLFQTLLDSQLLTEFSEFIFSFDKYPNHISMLISWSPSVTLSLRTDTIGNWLMTDLSGQPLIISPIPECPDVWLAVETDGDAVDTVLGVEPVGS